MQVFRGSAVLLAALLAGCASDRTVGLTPEVTLAKGTHMVPFKATQVGTALVPTGVVCPVGSFPGQQTVTGTGTQLGTYTGYGYGCTRFTSPLTFELVSGVNNVIAANGDELWIAFDPIGGGTGSVILGPNGPASVEWTGEYVVTGGTGRFAGATGRATAVGTRDLTVPGAPFLSDIVGEISSVGSK